MKTCDFRSRNSDLRFRGSSDRDPLQFITFSQTTVQDMCIRWRFPTYTLIILSFLSRGAFLRQIIPSVFELHSRVLARGVRPAIPGTTFISADSPCFSCIVLTTYDPKRRRVRPDVASHVDCSGESNLFEGHFATLVFLAEKSNIYILLNVKI